MQLLLDFIPILLFFIAFKVYDIYIATAVAIVASLLQTLWQRYRNGKFERMHLITLGLLIFLGGLTLLLQDERFIKWKPTLVNWAFAIGLIGARLITQKSAISLLLGSKINLPKAIWMQLDRAWFLFFIFLGGINLYVAYTYSTDTWVNFKLFGMLGLTILFILGQSVYLSKYITSD